MEGFLMTNLLRTKGSRAIVAGLVSVLMPSASLFASTTRTVADEPARIELHERDIKATNAKVAAAHGALVSMWSKQLQRLGVSFSAPRLVTYRGAVRTRCGVVSPMNASYCFGNNTIYFDEVFLAAQAKFAGHALGTDGDMAAIGIIAHEMGHAVAFQLRALSRTSYENEAAADCLAGAFARQAQADGSLEDGDLDEVLFALAAAGDPAIEAVRDRRANARATARRARAAHGTREQRTRNFRDGFAGGGGACLDELRA
jgi:predicted metalloprotease